LAQKVMSNFTNHLADTAVDEPFKTRLKGKAPAILTLRSHYLKGPAIPT
jgi:hypothetical protein